VLALLSFLLEHAKALETPEVSVSVEAAAQRS